MNKPLEFDEYMKPYRLFCTSARRVNPMYSMEDIIKGIMSMGYNRVEAMYYYKPIEEAKRQGLNKWQREGEE